MKIYNQKSPSVITEQYFQFDPSFGPYVFFLRQKMEESPEIIAKFYRYLIKKFQQHPGLLAPFKDVTIIEEHEELIQLLTMSLMPLSVHSDSYQMALAFMQPSCIFYCTPSFKETFIDQHIEFDTAEDEVSNLRYFVRLVLERCYNIKTGDYRGILKEVRNSYGDTIRHYRLSVDSSYIHVHSGTVLPPYNEDWLKMLSVSN
ncbi:MAG: hypothetical protein JWQ96_1653, partial [Segetibacter sp.]|nr:hypothetical protein [Segetibacter sp.]